MAEGLPAPQERPYINEPGQVIKSFFEQQGHPDHSLMTIMAKIINENGARAPWGTLGEAQAHMGGVTRITARMLDEGHEALPASWNGDAETARAVLTMAGHIEAGAIRAQQVDFESEHRAAYLLAIEGLIAALQAK